MNENLTVDGNYFDLDALAKCRLPMTEEIQEPPKRFLVQQQPVPINTIITVPEEPVKTVHNFGKRLAGDVSGANGLCLYEGNNKVQVRTEFLSPNLVKAERIKIHTKNDFEIIYRLYKKNFYVAADDDSFFMYLTDMDKWSKINRVLAMNGIAVTYTGRDAGQLFETFVNGITVSEIEYPYKPGWNGGIFRYNENGELQPLKNTPFLTKKLITDSRLSIKKSLDIIFKQLKAVENESLRMFIFLLMHLALLGEVMETEEIKKTAFGLFGDIKAGEQIGSLFFQFYNRNNREINFLYDKDIADKVDDCKDEVFVIIDSFPETKYKRICAENNFSDIKDIICKGNCEGFCLFVSDCGIVTDDAEVFHLTVEQKGVVEVENIKEALGTHIKFFTGWIEKERCDLKENFFTEPKEQSLCNTFFNTYLILEKYLDYTGGENLENALGLKSREQVKKVIQQIINDGFLSYRGRWICDQFKETFSELNLKRVRDKKPYAELDGDEPFVYITSQYVCFRRKDLALFLKDFSPGMREIDILKALKKYGWLAMDDEKRYEKTVKFQKEPKKMVAVFKEFLFPCGSIEGGI